MTAHASSERPAVIRRDGWAGVTEQRVLVVGETPRCYRIRATTETRLAGRDRYLRAGEEALVPRRAVRLLAPLPLFDLAPPACRHIREEGAEVAYDNARGQFCADCGEEALAWPA